MKNWWGVYDFNTAQKIQTQIGPLCLAIESDSSELRLFYDRDPDWQEHNEADNCSLASFFATLPLQERYVFRADARGITLLPALADRSVVVQPATPFYLPAGHSVTVFISTPLWVHISLGTHDDTLKELPTLRPSDTWFGPNTMEGELCYASHTSARISIDNLPTRSHRAITPVQIVNESSSALFLERINLPVTYLDIYETDSCQLWTQGVKMVKNANDETAGMELLAGPPADVAGAVQLTEARNKASERTIIRKISGFFA